MTAGTETETTVAGMQAPSPPAPRPKLTAAAIVTAAVVLTVAAGWNNSATNDEPYFTMAAWSAVAEGNGELAVEHPVLAWYLPGLVLQPLGLSPPPLPPGERLGALNDQIRRFLYHNRVPTMVILRTARLAMVPFLVLLLTGCYLWARDLGGERAGLWALLLLASQPLVLGHAQVVHTDIAAAAGWVWTLRSLHRWLRGDPRAWPASGAWLGVSLLAKFSSVYLALLLALAVLLAALRHHRRQELIRLAGVATVAGLVLVAGTWPAVRRAAPEDIAGLAAVHGSQWAGSESRLEVVRRLAAISVPAAHWALGLLFVTETNRLGQGVNFFLGTTRSDGFLLYFPLALLLKVSLPFLFMAALAAGGTLRRPPPTWTLPLAFAGAFLLAILGSSYNIGARHLMPMLPLLAVAGGCAVHRRSRPLRVIGATALVLGALAPFPHYISHFSLLIGGARYGHRYLHDSNVDWGQDWLRLARAAQQEAWSPLHFVYLGPADPGAHLPGAHDLLAREELPEAGYVAVSRWAEALGPSYLHARNLSRHAHALNRIIAFVRSRGTPVGQVGHSITVYRLASASGGPPAPPPAPPPGDDSAPPSSGTGTP